MESGKDVGFAGKDARDGLDDLRLARLTRQAEELRTEARELQDRLTAGRSDLALLHRETNRLLRDRNSLLSRADALCRSLQEQGAAINRR